ncbi:MAG: GGDEF domain-containing protein [Cyanobacteria bacterium]|nr:GGDEF domain-containing protein [Cyanobacteriota bacterium]
MTAIYLLSATPTTFTGFEQIRSIVGALYPIREVASMEALQGLLESEKEAVVVFHVQTPQISPLVNQIKGILSTASCIAVMDPEPNDVLLSDQAGLLAECDLLLTPLKGYEILSRISSAVRLTELRAVIEASSHMDEVAPLFNRKYFSDRLNSEISLSKRHLSPLCVVVIRLNFFQVYVDSYGYDFVVNILKYMAGIVKKQVRQEDIIARVSDDEIALLLPRSTEKGAKTLVSRIIQELTTQLYYDKAYMGDDGEELSAHAGVAGFPIPDDDSADADSLIRYARHALHQARCSEDNLIMLFSEIQPVF